MQAILTRTRRSALTSALVAFTRSSILEGDRYDGVAVLGFAFVAGPRDELVTGANDRLLLDGDQHLTTPPSRAVPISSDPAIEHTALLPAQRLNDEQIPQMADGLVARFTELMQDPARSWADFVNKMVDDLCRDGHVIMVAGGAVRDIVATGDPTMVNDLDMAGTVPAGQFTNAAYRRLALAGKTHFPQRVSARLVCSIFDGKIPIIEYKGFKQGGFRFHTTGGDLCTDAESRDFSVNALYYDPVRKQLLDPRLVGLADLMAVPRRLIPIAARLEAAQAADVVLRAVKFLHRWRLSGLTVDDSAVQKMVAALPPKCWDTVTKADWWILRRSAEKVSEEVPVAAGRAIAQELGSAAEDLLDRVKWGHDVA
jgi:poly(A) polymerase